MKPNIVKRSTVAGRAESPARRHSPSGYRRGRLVTAAFVTLGTIGGAASFLGTSPASAQTAADVEKAQPASALSNISIFSEDGGNPTWNVRVIIGDYLYENGYPRVRIDQTPRFSGICVSGPSPCRFDTYTYKKLPDGTLIESITAYGKYWNFTANGNGVPGNGSDLKSVPRYAAGPCADAVATGTPCVFDTRTFGQLGSLWVESITAYGKGYNFDGNNVPWFNNGFDLMSVARVSQGPCRGSVGTQCKLTDRTFHQFVNPVGDGIYWLEWILVDGQIWAYDINQQQRDPNTYLLASIPGGTPADQVNIFKPAFAGTGSAGRDLISPNESQASFKCDVYQQAYPSRNSRSYVEVLTFRSSGDYTASDYGASGIYQYNADTATITFVTGPWTPPPGTTGFGQGKLDTSNANQLTLTEYHKPPQSFELTRSANCQRMVAPPPPPPPPGGTGDNPLIPVGQSSSRYDCTVTTAIQTVPFPIYIDISVGDIRFNRDGTYVSAPSTGRYRVGTGNVEFIDGPLYHPAGNDRFATFSPQNPARLSLTWYGTPSVGTRPATCLRAAPGKSGNASVSVVGNTVNVALIVNPYASYAEQSMCDANKLFTTAFGRNGSSGEVSVWASTNLTPDERSARFVEVYKDSSEVKNTIDSLYKVCLLRDPSPGETAIWGEAMMTYGVVVVAQAISFTEEASSKPNPCTVVRQVQ
jgi:hypothetical protein